MRLRVQGRRTTGTIARSSHAEREHHDHRRLPDHLADRRADPGTGVYTVSTALARGKRASVYAALGCTAGIVPHLLATVLGLAAVMHVSALAFQVLKFAGMAYLFYLAIATWRDKRAFAIDAQAAAAMRKGIAIKAFLLNILNPKLTIFFLAFLPQFVARHVVAAAQLLLLSGVFMAMTFVVFVVYGCSRTRFAGGHRVAARAGVAAPRLLGGVRRARREPGAVGTLTAPPPRAQSLAAGEHKPCRTSCHPSRLPSRSLSCGRRAWWPKSMMPMSRWPRSRAR